MRLITRSAFLGLVALLALAFVPPADACPFCGMSGSTFTDDVKQASVVLFGTLANGKLDPSNESGGGTTDLNIETVIKKHDIVGDKKVVSLARYYRTDKDDTTKKLVFGDVYKDKIDSYRVIPVKNPDIVDYLKGALENKDKAVGERLLFFFKYLDSADLDVSNDAYKEFGNAEYKDFQTIAKKLPADKVAKWLADKDTPGYRNGLYASILGHSGDVKYADTLKKLLDDPQKRSGSGVDGMLAGYILLKPKEGWSYLTDVLKNKDSDFLLRYAGLKAVRFFWDSRPEIVEEKDRLSAIKLLLEQPDIADLAIEDLRKWKRFDEADKILPLYGKEGYDVTLVKRAIIRFALSLKDNAKAKALLTKVRKDDPDLVKDAEELLKLEEKK